MEQSVKILPDALLVLQDGTCVVGKAFGNGSQSPEVVFGEIVFNTAMTGYQETLTDPSYHQQIVLQTTPHIGNTGVNAADYESAKIWVAGYVVRELSSIASNWRSEASLESALERDRVIGIEGVDTRYLTRHLRDKGVMKSGIFIDTEAAKVAQNYCIGDVIPSDNPEIAQYITQVTQSKDMQGAHLAPDVSTKTEDTIKVSGLESEFGFEALSVDGRDISQKSARDTVVQGKFSAERPLRIVSYDLGIKKMTPKLLCARGEAKLEQGLEVINVPISTSIERISELKPDGVFFSNGPGDPSTAEYELEVLRHVLRNKIPFFGICMGNQMLGRALGFDTYKLAFGHRGVNQPVYDIAHDKVTITAHNHGFAVDIPLGESDQYGHKTQTPIVQTPYNDGEFGKARVSHISLNDNCVEGIELLDLPAFSVQYHPEAAAGPHDAVYLFDKFIDLMTANISDELAKVGKND